jgi:hypothetical protein
MGVYCLRIKSFNKLPLSIKKLVRDKKHFILALKRVLIVESFYSINGYLNYQHVIDIDDCSV